MPAKDNYSRTIPSEKLQIHLIITGNSYNNQILFIKLKTPSNKCQKQNNTPIYNEVLWYILLQTTNLDALNKYEARIIYT